MIKGWRTKPEWGAYYAARKEKYQQILIEKVKAKITTEMLMHEADMEMSMCERFRAVPSFTVA